MTTIQNPSQRDEEIDLGKLFGVLIDRKWLIAIVTLVFMAISVLYILIATPIYQAYASVQVERMVPSLPGMVDLALPLGATAAQNTLPDTEIALITSRKVIGQAVSNLKLDVEATPKRFPLIGGFIAKRFAQAHPGELASPWLGISRYDWGGAKLDVARLDVPDRLLGQKLLLIADGHDGYVLQDDDGNTLASGTVGQLLSGHGVSVQVDVLRANPGERFKLIRYDDISVISDLQNAISVGMVGRMSGVLGMTYNNSNPTLAVNLLDQVSKLYVRQNVDKNAAAAASSLGFIKEQMPAVRRDLQKATDALSAFQARANSVDITVQTSGLLNQEIAVDNSIQQLHQQQAQLANRVTPEHPDYKALMKQLGQLQARKAALEQQVAALPDTQQELLKLNRDVQVTGQTYTGLMHQAQQLEIAQAGTVGNARIVDSAGVDITQPYWPKKLIVLPVGTFLGLFLAIVYVFVRKLLNRGLEDSSAVEQLGLPVYASIPLSARQRLDGGRRRRVHGHGRPRLLVVDAPDDSAAEALRSLRTSLHFGRLEAKNNVLVIAGSSPDAGKSFVAANLAAVSAQGGQRVLLIDGDMRKGRLHWLMGGGAEDGLSELISGQLDIEAATRSEAAVQNLHFIARGKVPPNPSELLMSPRFGALLAKLMPLYDLIIIDTPPVLAVTDAAIIGQQASICLLVVRFGLNQAREIALATQRLEHSGVAVKGAIFNAVEKRSGGFHSYAYYDYQPAK